ncbi:MAG TPA: aminotransferase class I/II-fold pyridoxal phosphate-dependent enzyme [Gemmatimonadaceae bacterium]|nr:aminotransferase class I/II-fold pyridoxal phosphate-dependent enzyme [Gemmatimonadaceae bacterium]
MHAATRTATFTESVIREMTRIASLHQAVNLAQGFPDFPMPAVMKEAAVTAIHGDVNQYAVTWGAPVLRQAIAEKYRRWYDMEVDPDRDVTVTCGATEAMASVFMALMDAGDEVIIPEPFYENYGPDAILAGAKPVFFPFERDGWTLDADRLRKTFNSRTKAIIVNTPHNPTGRVLTRDEISLIAELCIQHDAWAITDSPYEHMVYSGHHHEIATWPGMRERTITISSLSKTFSCTGWRIGWIIAPPPQTAPIRKVHDFLTVGAPAPLQAAAAVGFAFDASYYNEFCSAYRARREFLSAVLREQGFRFTVPEGAYYIFADFSGLSDLDDVTFAKWMTQEIGVATVPGSSFYSRKEDGRSFVRFAFCKKQATLDDAAQRLSRLRATL